MPRIAYFETSTDTLTDWDAFCATIDSDSDPREIRRPEDDDEWEEVDEEDAAKRPGREVLERGQRHLLVDGHPRNRRHQVTAPEPGRPLASPA